MSKFPVTLYLDKRTCIVLHYTYEIPIVACCFLSIGFFAHLAELFI